MATITKAITIADNHLGAAEEIATGLQNDGVEGLFSEGGRFNFSKLVRYLLSEKS